MGIGRLGAGTTLIIFGLICGSSVAAQQREATTIISEIVPKQEAFKRCLIEQTVELGAENEEAAETVLRAVGATCKPAENALRALYGETPLSQSHVEQLMVRDRKIGEDAGVAALLRLRSKRGKPAQ